MRKGMGVTAALAAVAVIAGAAVLSADRLILRDGRRIEGQLISVQRGVIEFREDRGFRGSRTIEVRRDEVDRIELEEFRQAPEPDRREDRPDMRGSTRPNGLREREVWVPARSQWTDSGIDVRDGQVLYFDAHGGDIEWRRGRQTRANGDDREPYDRFRPIPGRGPGALIGKIGSGSTDYFFIGETDGPIRMRGAGRLFLGINDENVNDNQGAFRVTVFY